MANEGHIFIKRGEGKQNIRKQFFRPIDGKSARPVFCYPRRTENLREEVRGMERSLESGYVTSERKMMYELKLKERKKKLNAIEASFGNAAQVIKEDPDAWIARRDELATAIEDQTPTRKDVELRRVNPHAVLRREKTIEKGSMPLEEIKREYTIISRAFQAAGEEMESNHSFLQKEK